MINLGLAELEALVFYEYINGFLLLIFVYLKIYSIYYKI